MRSKPTLEDAPSAEEPWQTLARDMLKRYKSHKGASKLLEQGLLDPRYGFDDVVEGSELLCHGYVLDRDGFIVTCALSLPEMMHAYRARMLDRRSFVLDTFFKKSANKLKNWSELQLNVLADVFNAPVPLCVFLHLFGLKQRVVTVMLNSLQKMEEYAQLACVLSSSRIGTLAAWSDFCKLLLHIPSEDGEDDTIDAETFQIRFVVAPNRDGDFVQFQRILNLKCPSEEFELSVRLMNDWYILEQYDLPRSSDGVKFHCRAYNGLIVPFEPPVGLCLDCNQLVQSAMYDQESEHVQAFISGRRDACRCLFTACQLKKQKA